jgi:hypothetical protein
MKINPIYLIEIKQQNLKKKLKSNKLMKKLFQCTLKFNTIISKWNK